jgi:arginine transport system permease protein
MSWLAGFGPQLLQGLAMTVAVALCAFVFGMILAIIFTIIQFSHQQIIKTFISGIISIIRGLPELLVLFAIYFGGSVLFSMILHRPAQVSAFLAGVLALGSIFASYASQTLRGAFLAIHKGQTEAGKALGLSGWFVFKKILLPQAWRHALPGLGNLWLVLLKDSALVSLIGLADLMNRAQTAASTTNQPFKFYLFAAFCFLMLTTVSQWLLKRYEFK